MSSSLRPRLVSLEAFSGALLIALGLAPAGCASDVVTEDGTGGAGGSTGATPASGGGNPGSVASTGVSTGPGSGGGSSAATGSSTTASTGAGGEGGGGEGGSGSGGGTAACADPEPVLVDGKDTGLDRCSGGQLRRRASIECPVAEPDDETCCGECPDGTFCSTQGEVACSCVEQCSTDADCADGSICFCGDPAGWCVPSGCSDAGDCGAGQECTSWDPTYGCLYLNFACTTAGDTCGGDLDCDGGQLCSVDVDGLRRCMDGGCAIGRPFLVEGEARTAGVTARGDWAAGELAIRPIADDATRDLLAQAWEHTARMEHASIAAFARFSLQLLALGAPADLLERTHRALADETRHARLAFAVAGAYRGRAIGPGALPIDGALGGADDVTTFVRLLVREGCVGETVASLEAAELATTAEDPAIRGVLGAIAADEAAHAELAWRTARWAIDALGEEARLALAAELAHVEAEIAGGVPGIAATGSEADVALARHGVATDTLRATFRREALARAIAPCLRALVASSPRVARSAEGGVEASLA